MGCCISKTTRRPKPHRPSGTPPRLPPPLYYAGPSPPQPLSSPIPSPLPFEEESVKEVVLSETTLFPPPSPTTAVPESIPPLPARPQPSPPRPKVAPQVRHPLTPRKRDAAETDILISKLEQAADAVSEYSDMYTMSGSLSVSTTATTGTTATLADRKESEVTSKVSRPVARSSPNKPPRKRPPLVGEEERGRGVSPPARRLQQPSPESGRRAVVGQGRDPGGVWRNAGLTRRDSGEISRRRSSSPAQGRAWDGVRGGMGKSPSKRTGSAGNRSSGPVMENGSNPQRRRERDPEEESSAGGGHEVDDDDDVDVVSREDNDDVVRGGNENTANESLENPHVSLECFIFL